VLDAETEGQIGYLLELELANALRDRLDVVTLLTQTVVDPEDPAFQRPTKPIGRWLTHKDAEALRREKGWSVAQDGDRWRRVVPSPKPKAIVEARAVQILLNAGVVVICCGGGGIPVAVDVETGRKRGIEAVVDKDLASAVLASHLGANMLVMLTDQEAIFDPDLWPETKKKMPSPLSCSEARKHRFAEGSMKPKVEAACLFVEQTGGKAAVGKIEDLHAIIKGDAGTLIVAD
jgi:carbamate kinase